MKSNPPYLFIIAGPNGAGKSTVASHLLSNMNIQSFDWDYEFSTLWEKYSFDPLVQDGIRDSTNENFRKQKLEALKKNKHFAYETNFHSVTNFDIIQEFQEAKYEIVIYFLYISTIEKCKDRVALRVSRGGHFVSDSEIERRYNEGLINLTEALSANYTIYIYNSSHDEMIQPILYFEHGKLVENNSCTKDLLKKLFNEK